VAFYVYEYLLVIIHNDSYSFSLFARTMTGPSNVLNFHVSIM